MDQPDSLQYSDFLAFVSFQSISFIHTRCYHTQWRLTENVMMVVSCLRMEHFGMLWIRYLRAMERARTLEHLEMTLLVRVMQGLKAVGRLKAMRNQTYLPTNTSSLELVSAMAILVPNLATCMLQIVQ